MIYWDDDSTQEKRFRWNYNILNNYCFYKLILQYIGKSRDNYKYKVVVIGFLIHKQVIFFMEKLLETFILPINITMHEDSPIENLDSSIYNGQ